LKEELKTGTTTIGIICKDGIVLAADKRVTAGTLIANKRFTKLVEITNEIATTVAGSVSEVQLLLKLLKAEVRLKKIQSNIEVSVKSTANLLAGMVYSNIRQIGGISHFVLGGTDQSGLYIYDIFPDGSISEVDDYITSGSGSPYVYGILETEYTQNITVEQGIALAKKSIKAAMQRDCASGNGIDVLVITKDGITSKETVIID